MGDEDVLKKPEDRVQSTTVGVIDEEVWWRPWNLGIGTSIWAIMPTFRSSWARGRWTCRRGGRARWLLACPSISTQHRQGYSKGWYGCRQFDVLSIQGCAPLSFVFLFFMRAESEVSWLKKKHTFVTSASPTECATPTARMPGGVNLSLCKQADKQGKEAKATLQIFLPAEFFMPASHCCSPITKIFCRGNIAVSGDIPEGCFLGLRPWSAASVIEYSIQDPLILCSLG